MDAQRKRFVAALIVFVLWVGILGLLAIRSSKPPPRRPTVSATP